MEQKYIAAKAREFIDNLERIRIELASFEQSLISWELDVSARIRSFTASCKEIISNYKKLDVPGDVVGKSLSDIISQISSEPANWQNRCDRISEGRVFMEEHQKYLTVMVFGAVKSGKSTLGNFMAGRAWLDAPFDNRYKHLPVTGFSSQQINRRSGGITDMDQEGRRWFCEGVTDTTGDIQYFTLSALRWFDSPGTGSLGKEEDLVKCGELVEKYLQYADLCIFLVNSSHPGLLEDLKYIKLLDSSRQESLVVITRSDITGTDCDEKGRMIRTVRPKDENVRRAQEQYMCDLLGKNYPEVDPSGYLALSISVKLAQQAVAEGDAEKFRHSGLELLMDRIAAKCTGRVIELKKKRPREAFEKFIDDIITGTGDCGGVNGIRNGLEQIKVNITGRRRQIEDSAAIAAGNILNTVRSELECKLLELSQSVSKKNIFPAEKIAGLVAGVTAAELKRTVASLMDEMTEHNFDDEGSCSGAAVPEIRSKGIRPRLVNVSCSYTEAVVEQMEAENLLEQIMQGLGNALSTVGYRERTRVVKIESGTNIEEVLEELLPQLDDYVKHTVVDTLHLTARKLYFAQEELVNRLEQELDGFSAFLEDCKTAVHSLQ